RLSLGVLHDAGHDARRRLDEHQFKTRNSLTALDGDRLRLLHRDDAGVVNRRRLKIRGVVAGHGVAALSAQQIAAWCEPGYPELAKIIGAGALTRLRPAASRTDHAVDLDLDPFGGFSMCVDDAASHCAAAIERNLQVLDDLTVLDH